MTQQTPMTAAEMVAEIQNSSMDDWAKEFCIAELHKILRGRLTVVPDEQTEPDA